jgi:hypothetical protein
MDLIAQKIIDRFRRPRFRIAGPTIYASGPFMFDWHTLDSKELQATRSPACLPASVG